MKMVLGWAFSRSFRASLSLLVAFPSLSLAAQARMERPGPGVSGAMTCPAFQLKSENGGDPGNIEGDNNAQVLAWKASSKNQFHSRAHVQGDIVRLYPNRNGHQHFSIQIGPGPADTIEIVYNMSFGTGPKPAVGAHVEACGDYITSTGPSPAPGGKIYPASPDGAIVHWVHRAPARSGHNSGFLMIGGEITGQEDAHSFE